MKLIFVSHPFGGDQLNLRLATKWTAWLNEHLDALFIAPWIPLCRHWPDSGAHLDMGMQLNFEAIRRADGLILVGASIGAGGARERDFAIGVGLLAADFAVALTPDHLSQEEIARLESIYGKRTL